jgi:hypothetical protein
MLMIIERATWGEEKFIAISQLSERYLAKSGKLSLCVKFEVLESKTEPSFLAKRVTNQSSEKFFNKATAHKVILAGTSPFFESMFTNGMQETYSSEILLNDTDPAIFFKVLYYCYTMKLESSSSSETEKVIIMADRFGIDSLKEEGFRQLRKDMTARTVWDTWALAGNSSIL